MANGSVDYFCYKKNHTLLHTLTLRLTRLVNAPCAGNAAWTPVENTYNHFLTLDLGDPRMVRKIATMGRMHTDEFVTEYIVQYSDDGEFWRSYVNPTSEPQVLWLILELRLHLKHN